MVEEGSLVRVSGTKKVTFNVTDFDNKVDFDESIQVFAEIFRGSLDEAFELITKNIDLRDKKSVLQEGIIDYNFDVHKSDVESLKSKIEQNKISVLFELYKEIIDSVYE